MTYLDFVFLTVSIAVWVMLAFFRKPFLARVNKARWRRALFYVVIGFIVIMAALRAH